MSEQPVEQNGGDLDHGGQEGHHFHPVLIVAWVAFVAWMVGYVIKNIGQSW